MTQFISKDLYTLFWQWLLHQTFLYFPIKRILLLNLLCTSLLHKGLSHLSKNKQTCRYIFTFHSEEQLVRWLIWVSTMCSSACMLGICWYFGGCEYQGVVGKDVPQDVSQPAYHDSLRSHTNGQSCRWGAFFQWVHCWQPFLSCKPVYSVTYRKINNSL